MKNILLAACLVLAVLTCSSASAQCENGSCALPGRPVVRATVVVRSVAVRPFFRGRRFGGVCRGGRCQ